MIENMGAFMCPHCQHITSIFLSGGVEREAKKYDIPVLGSVPLNEGICGDSDKGRPSVVAEGQDGVIRGQVFRDIAEKVLQRLEAS
jgi:ATP-binding protein involved in chromosome partitioning